MATNQTDKPRTPKDVSTLKSFLSAVLEQTIPNLQTFREKEWAMALRDQIKGNTSIEGKSRHIRQTGIVRKVDELGRLVIPKELRKTIGIRNGDPIQITTDDTNGMIVIEPFRQFCHFCSGETDVHPFKEKFVCEQCLAEMVNTL